MDDNKDGFTVVIEHESGGKLGSWYPNLEQVFIHVKRAWGDGDNYIRIFPKKFKDRVAIK